MAGFNKVILVGNLGKDPETRNLEGGIAVSKFPLATSETIKDKNGNKVEQTEWHNVVVWRGLAEIAEKFLKKGSTVYIEGKIRSRSWEDKDGIKRYITEVVGDNLTLLNKKEDQNSGGMHQNSGLVEKNNPVQLEETTKDLPF